MSDEVESMMATSMPWHRKGTIVSEAPNAKEALVLAGLDWQVDLLDLEAIRRDPKTGKEITRIPVLDHFANVRDLDDAVMGVVGKVYKELQNHIAFEFFDSVLDDGVKYDAAGSLFGGRVVWLTAKLPEGVLVAGEQRHDLYIVLSTSHDGSRAVRIDITPTVVVCRNTMNLALNNSVQHWTIRHTESVDGKIAEAREALKLTFAYRDEYKVEMDKLADQAFTDAEFERLVANVFPARGPKDQEPDFGIPGALSPDQYAMVGVRGRSQVIPDELRKTKYGSLMAVTEYLDHHREVKVKMRDPLDAQLDRLWFGNTKDVWTPKVGADAFFQALKTA